VLALLAVLALAGCGGRVADDDPRPAVVATTTQLADFARVVGGDRVRVTGILKPNVDAHDFEPSPADVDVIARAKVLIENGAGLESWLGDTVSASGFSGARVDASQGVELLGGPAEGGDEAAGAKDPHIWQDVANAKVMVANVERGLAAADPAGAATFEANRERYDAELDTLDARIRKVAATIPAADRKLVTNHEAFNYFARAYGFQVVGAVIPSFDTSAELSAREISDLVARIRETGTRAVFSEASLPPRTAETIGREAGVEVVAGEDALYGDSLGPPGSAGDTYLKMMAHNADVIAGALGSE
jgi:zinc/manganese transport system substrate-binding protein/manganese/iron transport system substrate-binding protein